MKQFIGLDVSLKDTFVSCAKEASGSGAENARPIRN